MRLSSRNCGNSMISTMQRTPVRAKFHVCQQMGHGLPLPPLMPISTPSPWILSTGRIEISKKKKKKQECKLCKSKYNLLSILGDQIHSTCYKPYKVSWFYNICAYIRACLLQGRRNFFQEDMWYYCYFSNQDMLMLRRSVITAKSCRNEDLLPTELGDFFLKKPGIIDKVQKKSTFSECGNYFM